MMSILHAAILALGVSEAFARVAVAEKRAEAETVKYCPESTAVCFSEFKTPSSYIVYRIAIPDVSSAPFDVILQIIAPVSTTGWAGLAWGGSMTKNPLTIGWAGGSSAIASSRWVTGHTLPQAYTGATYTVLQTSTTNATHWQLDVHCSGCSQWQGASLNPNGPNTFAWAKGNRAVTTPASNTSTFAYHDDKGVFSHDLSLGKIPKGVFDALAYDAGSSGKTSTSSSVTSSSSASAPTTPVVAPTSTITTVVVPTSTASSTSVPIVVTSVTTLPKPPTTPTSPTATRSTTTVRSSTTVKPTQSTTSIIIVPPPTTSKTTTAVTTRPKQSTTAIATPPWIFRPPPFGKPPFRGPPWRRPPVAGDELEEVGE